MSKQAEHRARAYIECLGDMEKALRAKGIDLALPVIIEIRMPFSPSSAPDGF